MRHLGGYLKRFTVALLIAVALLFVQAVCDLNLPNYMSEIVNVGIQQNGIEHASPDAISAKGMTFETTFMTQEQKENVESHYTLFKSGGTSPDQAKVEQRYPLLEQEDIYVLNEGVSKEARQELDSVFGESAWTFINTLKSLPQMESAAQGGDSSDVNLSDVDITQLYAMQPVLSNLPAQVIDDARAQAQTNDASMLTQTGAAVAGMFYTELGVDVGGIQTGYITRTGLWMLLIALIGGVATVLVGLLAARISSGVAHDLRRDVFRKVESFSSGEYDKFSTSSLITRTTNDVMQIQMLAMMAVRMLFYAPIMGVGGTFMALRKSTSMSWLIALACVVLICLVLVIFFVAMPKFKSIQKLIDKLNRVSRENLNGLMVIRAFGTQEFEKGRFDEANMDLTKTNRFVNRVMTLMMPAMTLIMNGTTLLIVWVGAQQIAKSAMQVGDMMAFMQYAMQIIMSFLVISMMFIMVPRAAVSGDRIYEVLNTEPSIKDPDDPQDFSNAEQGTVEFDHVSFRYGGADEEVLHDVTFAAKPGETTAIIGSTGSGKSTLVNLIPRFYEVTGGSIKVDGKDVREVTQHDLREKIGFVPQKGVLLSGTIQSNLRYGRPEASEEEIRAAAQTAQAMEFIDQKEEGMESEISQGGTNVSGGQKQRLAIARALVKKPDVYIFDDSFSALDFKTDRSLRAALADYTGNSTVIIVAQRVSTIMHANQILVLDEGRIVGRGTHEELLKNCPTYYEIAASQLSKEELA